ncbi:hypothetical protein CesoFtcFv8_004446 [Champsocephalus esox]|uniref:Uncharacterized protein n=1 Tax=Champsocephalus esox TaxID=159716 RepID=A0AAN8HCJ3_9TELE|nr:hypothetical protein CesoFtcFv8_004446 [Champsocephalus esox]
MVVPMLADSRLHLLPPLFVAYLFLSLCVRNVKSPNSAGYRCFGGTITVGSNGTVELSPYPAPPSTRGKLVYNLLLPPNLESKPEEKASRRGRRDGGEGEPEGKGRRRGRRDGGEGEPEGKARRRGRRDGGEGETEGKASRRGGKVHCAPSPLQLAPG